MAIYRYIRAILKTMKRTFIILIISILSFTVKAQVNVRDSIVFAPLLDFTYALQFPGGDMADRFGTNNNLGGSFLIKNRHNWIYGVSGGFVFGTDVKESSVIEALEDDNGGIVGTTGRYANIILQQRGFTAQAVVGKIFPWFGPNQNSGVMIMGGVGFIQHKIRFQDEIKEVPLLNDDYAKGFDRLTNGLLTSEFIGYRYMANNRLLNFYAGVEFMQGFTKNRRSFNYDTREEDTKDRLDLLTGIKVGITIPLYKKAPKDFYYN